MSKASNDYKDIVPLRSALVTVFDKTGLENLARELHGMGVKLYATSGTGGFLEEKYHIPVIKIEGITQFPELMEGRVKTLHPRIFGGVLARRYVEKDLTEAETHGIPLFDAVIGNLYPFWEHLGEEANAQSAFIDIGGPSLLRAAAKNSVSVTVVSDPADYTKFLEELKKNSGGTSLAFRRQMAGATFQRTSAYDGLIAAEWNKTAEISSLPNTLSLTPQTPLRYGENPHQKAAWCGTASWKVLQGKELSYNNLLDAESAVALVNEFKKSACAIIKHNNPCGVAASETSLENVFLQALSCDEKSAFGGIVAFNREVDEATAKRLAPIFLEVIIAPRFSAESLEVLSAKKNLRLIEWAKPELPTVDVRKSLGGWLVQSADTSGVPAELKTVTTAQVASASKFDLEFAWLVCKHVRSNAIVLARDGKTIGIGAGQMSRVDAVKIALEKAGGALDGAVLASDAFFPFRDNIDLLAGKGIAAVVQPGGSQRDPEVIAACNELGIAMVFTGQRHFRH